MQVIIINKHYVPWEFESVQAAMSFISKDKEKDYFTKEINGKKVRVYCPYDCLDCRNINCKYRRD